jgi:hypothetical protein
MSRVPGKLLNRVLWPGYGRWNGSYYRDVVLRSIQRAANWLVSYQEMTCQVDSPRIVLGRSLHEYLISKLKSCDQHGLDTESVERIRRSLTQKEKEVSDASSPSVPLCSFDPEHIFVSGDRVSVVDYEEPDCGWPAQDPASFLAYIDLKWTIHPGRISHEDILEIFQEAFTAKYDSTFKLTFAYMYLSDLLDAFLDRWSSPGVSFLTRSYLSWKSRWATNLIRNRSRASWEALMN